MKSYNLKYRPFGDKAILIEWPQEISEEILHDILRFKAKIEVADMPSVLELVSAYASMTIYLVDDSPILITIDQLKELYENPSDIQLKSQNWKIPVCYDPKFGTDMEDLSKGLNMDVEQIIAIHSAKKYLVHFTGFLPGFLYLGGLDNRLHYPRKKVPALKIPGGSIGIGGNQTGIYPVESPGGWNIIGKTPVAFFDNTKETPCFISPGDTIQFQPIDIEQYMIEEHKLAKESVGIKPITK
ncbi:MAG: 5-oxoprolinase subunit PxpB [Cyclobacteriaceae bacterium]